MKKRFSLFLIFLVFLGAHLIKVYGYKDDDEREYDLPIVVQDEIYLR